MIDPGSFQFHKSFEVGSFQASPEGKIRLSCLADLLQEIAWKHADSADFGRALVDRQLMWALSRLEIKVSRFPVWGECVDIHTAGRGVDKLFAFREFLVCGAQGEILVEAMSSWLLLDMESKKIQKPAQVLPSVLFDPRLAPRWQPAKISISGQESGRELLTVKYSDLDLYHHVNNTSYIRWVEDFLAAKGIFTQQLGINYLGECLMGDQVELGFYPCETGGVVAGKVGKKTMFLARV